MTRQPYVYIAAAAVLGLLLGYLLWKARPSARRTAAAVLTGNLLLWLVAEALVALSAAMTAAVVIRGTYAVIAWIPFTVHRLVAVLDDAAARRHRVVAGLTAAFGVTTLVLLPTDLVIAGVQHDAWGFHRISGPLFLVFSATLFAALLLDGALLVHGARHAPDPLRRLQSQYTLIALAANVVLGLVNLAVLQPLHLPAYHLFVVPLGIIVATATFIYAIARSRLVDLPTALRRGVLYTALLGALLIPCLGISLLAEQWFTGTIALGPSVITAVLFGVAGFGFPRLRLAAEQSLAHLLFGARADHRRLLHAASREVTMLLSLPTLAAVTRDTLGSALDGAEATLWRRDGKRFVALDRPDAEVPPLDQVLVSTLEGAGVPLVISEVEEGHPTRALAEALRARAVELTIGLRVKDRLVGLLTVGRRRDQRLHDDDDIALVMTLANQLAIALENARLYDELRQSRDEVNRVTRLSAVGTLAAGIAHEVRNPLVAVRTFLELFPDRLNDHRFLADFGKLALNEMGRVERLITDLLTLARGHERKLTALDVAAVVEPVVRLVGPQAQQRDITVCVRIGPHVPRVYGSAEQLEQVILNLVLNAIHASPDGGTVTVRLDGGRGKNGQGEVRLEVVDSGPGVPAEHREAIFTPFFTTKDGGTGLGLAIAHEIVAEHGGSLTVSSTSGGGATFVMLLPTSARIETQAA